MSFLAIERLKGTVPRKLEGSKVEIIKWAYGELHELTGNQGRLIRVKCLERGGWILLPFPPRLTTSFKVIAAIEGRPTFDPIQYRGPGPANV